MDFNLYFCKVHLLTTAQDCNHKFQILINIKQTVRKLAATLLQRLIIDLSKLMKIGFTYKCLTVCTINIT